MMKILLIAMMAMACFVVAKSAFFILPYKISNALRKVKREVQDKFEWWISIAIQMFFLISWLICMEGVRQNIGLTNTEFYVCFVIVGVSFVVWSYLSWSAEHIWIKPCVANKEQRTVKKIIVYLMIFIFVIVQGYYQSMEYVDSNVKLNPIFSVANYSIIVGAIALDRIINQACILYDGRKEQGAKTCESCKNYESRQEIK